MIDHTDYVKWVRRTFYGKGKDVDDILFKYDSKSETAYLHPLLYKEEDDRFPLHHYPIYCEGMRVMELDFFISREQRKNALEKMDRIGKKEGEGE